MRSLVTYIKENFKINHADVSRFSALQSDLWNDETEDNSIVMQKRRERFVPKLAILVLAKSLHTGSNLQLIYNSVNVKFALIKSLQIFGAIRLYGRLAERLVVQCKRYSITETGLALSRILVKRYSIFEYNSAKLKEAVRLQMIFKRELEIELISENYYSEFVSKYNKRKSHNPEILEQLEDMNAELRPMESQLQNPKFILTKHLLQMMEAEMKDDHQQVAHICLDAIRQFKELKYHYPQGILIFSNHLSRSQIKMGNYEAAKKSVVEAASNFKNRTHAWVRNREMLFLVYMRQLEIDQAEDVLKNIHEIRNFKSFGSEMRDRIYLFQLYIDLFQRPEKLKFRRIDLDRYASDTRGMNLSLIIMELIELIQKNKLSEITQRRTNIELYLTTHAKQNPRTKLFIRLLLSLPRAKENWHRWINYTNRIYGKMIKSTDSVEEIEIVGYEELWKKMAAEALKNHVRYKAYQNPKVFSGYEIAGL